MDFFADQGFDTWCFDMEGYGRSDKKRAINCDISNGADDAAAATDYIMKTRGVKQFMVYGISSGALRAAMFAGRHPERVSRLALDAFTHVDAPGPKGGKSTTPHEWKRVLDGRDDATDPGSDDAFRARPGSSVMRTRLERAIERRSTRALPRLVEGVDLGVGIAGPFVRPVPDHHPFVGHDARPDHRIRRRPADPAPRVLQRPAHPVGIVRNHTGLPLALEERGHVLLRRERDQVVDPFTDTHKPDGELEVVSDRHGHSPLGRPVQLREDDPCHARHRRELTRLLKSVLSDGGVEHQEQIGRAHV